MVETLSETPVLTGKVIAEHAENSAQMHGHLPYIWAGTAPYSQLEQPTDLFCGHPRFILQCPGAITSGQPIIAGFDCSGWVRYILCRAGDTHPDLVHEWDPSCNGMYTSFKTRTDINQLYEGPREHFDPDTLEPGDIVVFGRDGEQSNTYSWNHIGITSDIPGHMYHSSRYKLGSGDLIVTKKGEDEIHHDMVGGINHIDIAEYQAPEWEKPNHYISVFRYKENPTEASFTTTVEHWELADTFTTTHGSKDGINVLHVTIQDEGGNIGHGEGTPYYGESIAQCLKQIESVREKVTATLCNQELQKLLPPGAARNAIDCALHNLKTKQQELLLPKMYNLPTEKEYKTCMTIGIADPETTREKVRAVKDFPFIKVKCDGADIQADLERLEIIKEEAPQSEIWIDANTGWDREKYMTITSEIQKRKIPVTLIEQPAPPKEDQWLSELKDPSIPICADESCHTSDDLEGLVGKYKVVNIKLDKTGGFTEALKLLQKAHELGFDVMLGNMNGTSLAMEPLLALAGHPCVKYLDLDGPLLLKKDREMSHISYNRSRIQYR